MYMQLGRVHAIVVSSPRAAELFLKTHDLDFPSRPLTKTSNQISYGRKGIIFAQYDSHWRNMRKMCTLELFSFLKINSFSSMRKQEVRLLVDDLQEAAENRVAVNLSSKISCLIVDIMCLMVVGRKYRDKELDAKGFKAVIQEATRLAAAPNLGDFFPFIARLDLQGLCRRAKSVGDVFDGFLEKIVEEHVVSKNDKNKDFVDVMLDLMGSRENDYQIDCSTIKAMILVSKLLSLKASKVSIIIAGAHC